MDYRIRLKNLNDISLMEIYKDDGIGKKPLVILYHGYVGQKEFMMAQAYNLARYGFYVVLPDAWGHGERNRDGVPSNFFEAIAKTTDEINQVIDSYDQADEVDINRVGLTGGSMGGCITFNYLVSENRKIKAAVPVIGTPDWVSIMETKEAEMLFLSANLVSTSEQMKKHQEVASMVQPLNKYTNMKDTPLLILNGEEDPIIPVGKVKDFYEKLKPLYARPEEIQLITYPGIGHTDTLPINIALAEWFLKYI